MSASREKKVRQERGDGYVSPRQQKELEEARAARRSTIIFAACAVLFVGFVAFTLLNNSGVFKRAKPAAVVNGKTYSVSDMAYYYYNIRANVLNDNSDLDSSASLRTQEYTEDDEGDNEFETWYDYAVDRAIDSVNQVEQVTRAAAAAGYDGGEDAKESYRSTMDSLKSSASSSGYTLGGYIKAIFNGLLTRAGFEKLLRTAVLTDSYATFRSNASGYTDAELQAAYDADPNAYSMVAYEAVVFPSSDYAPETDEEADADAEAEAEETDNGSAAALAAAQDALARYKSGEKLEDIANESGLTYMNTSATYGTGSAMLEWLFDDARKSGDADVVDYTYYGASMGSVVVVFHEKSIADYHRVSVRHILVEDEATAQELLAEYKAGEQTEDAFAALATEHSTDTGSTENGGLYENVYKGQMVAPFEAWCFDESREPGDTGIVQTDYGYHVMYFVSRNESAYWQEMAASKLANDWSESLSEEVSSELLDGMKYIDP